MSTWLYDDCERPKGSLCEFPQEPSRVEAFDFDKSLVTDLKVQCHNLSKIHRFLVSQLCSSHLTEDLVEESRSMEYLHAHLEVRSCSG